MYLQYTNSNAGKPFGSQYQIMDAKELKRKRDRERYARMTDEQKKEILRKRREAYQRNKTIKEAKQNAELDSQIATAEEVGTSTLDVRQTKHVTPGERQTLLHRRNEEFSKKQRKTNSVSSQDTSPSVKHPQVLINGNTKILNNTQTFQKLYKVYIQLTLFLE